MTKRILLIYYSQSGQLGNILNSFSQAFLKKDYEVEVISVIPETPFPFPWTGKSFFSIMPDCVQGRSIKLKEFKPKHQSYDLIVLGYQPWFLSPSLTSNAILEHPNMAPIFENTPVIAITGARNMWMNAFEKIKTSLKAKQANLVGHIVLVDRNPNLISVITILYWMFTAKRDKYLGIFPKPGVSEKDIQSCQLYGELTEKHLQSQQLETLQDDLLQHKALQVNYNLMYTESKAGKLFKIWANFIDKRQNKSFWLVVFKYYLLIALFIAAPIIILLHTILVKPFISKRIYKKIKYFQGVN